MEHRLKTLPEYIDDVAAGRKSFEVRRDDREPPFSPGDTILLEEWSNGCYTGRWVRADVDMVLRNEYCRDGYCIMSITPTAQFGFCKPTNADRIRDMSDEELAELLCTADWCDMCDQSKDGGICHAVELDGPLSKYCVAAGLKWLTQPAQEG